MKKYISNNQLLVNLEKNERKRWIKILDDLDREEENYLRKMRYHAISSLDFIVSKNNRNTTLHELIITEQYSAEHYIVDRVNKQLYHEALAELDDEHRIVFIAMFENKLSASKACKLICRSDKTAKKYYLEACKYVLKKLQK